MTSPSADQDLDLVARLRDYSRNDIDAMMDEAADKIERLLGERGQFEQWCKAWHGCVEAMCTMLDISSALSPAETLSAVQHKATQISDEKAASVATAWREACEACLAAQPSTSADPNEDAYQRGKFDGVLHYMTAIRQIAERKP